MSQNISTSSHLCNLCLLFESFWSQDVSKSSTNVEVVIPYALKQMFADFGWKMAHYFCKKSERSKILLISDIFSEFLFEIEKFWEDKIFEKL